MPDEEGYLLPGELGGGAYAALEGDLGEVLRPLAGFGRDLEEYEEDEEESVEFIFEPEGVRTKRIGVSYILRGWNT